MSRFGALAEFDLDHFYLRVARVDGKLVRVKRAIVVAATEVAGRYLPDEIAAMGAVVDGDRAFTRVMRKTTTFGPRIQCLNCIRTEGTKTHGRDVENAAAIRLRTPGADGDAKVVGCQLGRG